MLFCPASQPKMFLNAPVFHPDAILFDLEDAVAYAEKDSARDLLCEAMGQLDFGACRVFVRHQLPFHTPFGEEDVRAAVPAGIRYLRLAMCETAADVRELDGLLDAVEAECQIPSHSVKVQCSIETARGVLNAREIVAASSRVISLSFGAEELHTLYGNQPQQIGPGTAIRPDLSPGGGCGGWHQRHRHRVERAGRPGGL